MQPGERWGYRARANDAPVEVELLRIGTKRPLRVLVRFVEAEHEGLEHWVPPARLKAPWTEMSGWLAHEERWSRVCEASGQIYDCAEEHALHMVFDHLRPTGWTVASPGYNRTAGVLRIHDVEQLITTLDLERDVVLGHPLAFPEGTDWIVPWAVTEQVVQRLARLNASSLLTAVDAMETEAAHEAVWGRLYGHGGEQRLAPPEWCAEHDLTWRPARDLVRTWCGASAGHRHEELIALRAEVVRLGELIESAIAALRASGDDRRADALECDLGVPIAVLRAQHRHPRA